jgi:hypothetical protein
VLLGVGCRIERCSIVHDIDARRSRTRLEFQRRTDFGTDRGGGRAVIARGDGTTFELTVVGLNSGHLETLLAVVVAGEAT